MEPKIEKSSPLADSPRPEVDAEFLRRAKRQVRARMKALRQSHPATVLARRSLLVGQRLSELQAFAEASSIAFFWPILERGEVDLRDLVRRSWERGVRTYFPFMDYQVDGKVRTGFREVLSEVELATRGSQFVEPPAERPVATQGDIDLVVVPALAADARGHRIGYGMGYYDATLADVAPPASVVIVVYGFQLLAELPSEAHDVAADYVVTEDKIWAT